MISNAGPRRTSEQDCSKKEKRKAPGVQQSVTKDLRGKINKTPTGAFKMVHDAASLNSKTRSRRLQGGKFSFDYFA